MNRIGFGLRARAFLGLFLAAMMGVGLALQSPLKVAASGGSVTFTSYSTPSGYYDITVGSDGNLWVVGGDVGSMTTAGVFTNYSSVSGGTHITAGPDGNLWTTNDFNGAIQSITTAGVATSYSDGANSPRFIVAGSDGNLWFTQGRGGLGQITTAGSITQFAGPDGNGVGIAAGPDGNLWVADGNTIGQMTTAGVYTSFTDPSINSAYGIAAGPDGALWFTDSNNTIGRITTSGVVTSFTGTGISSPRGITAGPDGNMWFINGANNSVGMITMAGVVSNFTDPSIASPSAIVAGPDGNLWVTNGSNSDIAKISFKCSSNNTVCNGNENLTLSAGALTITNVTDGALTGTVGNPTTDTPGYLPTAQFGDETGSGAGWNVTVGGTQFTGTSGAALTNSATLDPNAMLFDATDSSSAAIAPTSGSGNAAAPGTWSADGTVIPSDGTSIKIFSAAVNTGMGQFSGNPATVVDLTPGDYSGSYQSTITYTIASTP